MSETIPAVAFYLLAFAALGGAVSMMATRNVVHATVWLLEVMLATAGIYLLLGAEFLALVQVLVYAGAVAVLTLFTVMLTLRRREDAVRPFPPAWGSLALASLFTGAVLLAIRGFCSVAPEMPAQAPGIEEFGIEMFTTWMVPFEIASLVLLVALIGAVWWTGGDDR
ncbi:MAG TPA: NADH-quinone oxidoreductase subunit J [Actinobacteria bacterium]|nr:NADH-quinone oxidoreductase subunit J [Actinomycetota bacterium]